MTTTTQSSTCPELGKQEDLAAGPVQQEHNFRAWLSVLGAAVAFFCTSGFMNAFGLFQEYYAQHQLSDMSAFDISWIGPFAMFMMLFGAGIAGVFVDRTGPTVLICAGSIGIIFAITQKPPKKKLDLSILEHPAFLPFASRLTIFYLGMFSPSFFISTYATSLGKSDSFAFYLISIMNATSMFGRIIPGLLADRYGAFNACLVAAILFGIIGFSWTAADTSGGLIVWSMAYGFASGAILSLQITCAAQISSPESRGTSLGLAIGASALTGLFGTPISGQLISHGYLALSMYVGSSLTVGGLLFTWARVRQSKSLMVKI